MNATAKLIENGASIDDVLKGRITRIIAASEAAGLPPRKIAEAILADIKPAILQIVEFARVTPKEFPRHVTAGSLGAD